MHVEQKICGIIEASLTELGYELVRVKYFNRDKMNILQIMIARLDLQPINVDDCETVSRTASALLDVEDPITNAYNLEVSSPGIDRPLVKLKDYVNHISYEIMLTLYRPIGVSKRLQGRLIEVTGDDVIVRSHGIDYKINLQDIESAKLALTDELLKKQQTTLKAVGKLTKMMKCERAQPTTC